jgi:hypothetical protein
MNKKDLNKLRQKVTPSDFKNEAMIDEATASAELSNDFLQVGSPDECKKCGLLRSTIESVELEEKLFKCDHEFGDNPLDPNPITLDQKLRYFRSVWGYHLPEDGQQYLDELIKQLK